MDFIRSFTLLSVVGVGVVEDTPSESNSSSPTASVGDACVRVTTGLVGVVVVVSEAGVEVAGVVIDASLVT